MKKRITFLSAMALCLLAAVIFGTSVSAEFKFKEFKSDREKFERYTDEAENSVSEQDWQDILDSGKQEMLADWERSANSEAERYIRQGVNEDEVKAGMEESRASWENDFEKAEAGAKGSWYIKREKLVFEDVDFSLLRQSIKNAGEDSNIKDVPAWDSYVSGSLSDVNLSWDMKYLPALENLKDKGGLLTGDVKAGFETELAAFENSLREKFEIERNSILFSGRNIFITELYVDTDSLKFQSEVKSADAATENIIKDVQDGLKSEEDEILNKNYNEEGRSLIDFSHMGDNWEEELKQLVNTGMERWNSALERLYQQMMNWKQSAEDAYVSADALWRSAAEKLEKAKLEWENKLSKEIYEALDKWQSEETELSENIERSRQDFTGYMNNLSNQWNDHSSGLIDMAVNGSKVYSEAADNIKWLEEMSKKYTNQGAFQSTDDIKKYLSSEILSDVANMIVQFPGLENNYKLCPKFLSSSLNSSGTELTEKYTVDLVYVFPASSGFFAGGEFTFKSYTWDNVVNASSDPARKSSYFYYKTELVRWTKIKNSFTGIALDAENYMHEANMLGQDGSGYLTNADGSYQPNRESTSGDPYLMTEAEFALEISRRNKDFWESRLKIAKAVLDYSVNVKPESASETKAKKDNAEALKNNAKADYEKALNDIKNIVDKLKSIQGAKPLTAYDPLNITDEWKKYNASIESLTQKYTEANAALKAADEDYMIKKRYVILFENGENAEYLKKEIGEIEKSILSSEKDLYLKRIELYKKEIESDYAERTAGFASNYEMAVKNLEESKSELSALCAILSGEENDEKLVLWGQEIIAKKDIIWKQDDNVDDYANTLTDIINRFKSSDSTELDERRIILSGYIRGIYFNLKACVESGDVLLTKLRDGSFDPDSFLKGEYSGSHSIYKKYAEYSINALAIVDEAFDHGNDYNTILSYLQGKVNSKKYIYNADNSDFIEHYTALEYFKNRYKGLSADSWNSRGEILESDLKFSEIVEDLHDDETPDIDELAKEKIHDAAAGDMDAAAWLREYYMNGSVIAGIEYITEYDKSAEMELAAYEELSGYVEQNYRYFRKGEEILTGYGYLQGLLGYINIDVQLSAGGDNPFSIDAFKGLNPEDLCKAADAFENYIKGIEKNGIPVPDFLKSAAETIMQIKENLDIELFISRYMTGDTSEEMSGTVDDIYSRKNEESLLSTNAMEFISGCGDVIMAQSGDDYSSAVNILSLYETLSENEKSYIKNHKSESVSKLQNFVEKLYEFRTSIEVEKSAADYASLNTIADPASYADSTGFTGDKRTSLIALITPLYEKRLFRRNFEEGKIKDINEYIGSRNLEGKIEDELRSYALINEYLNRASDSNMTSTDPAFSKYMQTKNFKDLPEEVKIFQASRVYYEEAYLKSRKDITDIGEFLENRLGDDGVDGDVIDAVEEYAGRLNAVSLFYGKDVESYADAIGDKDGSDTRQYFLMYINGETSAILPGFEYGIYSDISLFNGRVNAGYGELGMELYRFSKGYNELFSAQEKYCKIADAGLKNALALKSFYENGASEKTGEIIWPRLMTAGT